MKTETTTKTRAEIYANLEQKYMENFAGYCYPYKFEAQGAVTECNLGGLLVILSKCGEGLIVWRDWADNAVSEELTECEICYLYNEETDENEAFFTYEGSKIDIYNILKI